MKYFSLTCRCSTNEYDTQVLPLLRRMSNLEELALNIINDKLEVHLSMVHKLIMKSLFMYHVFVNLLFILVPKLNEIMWFVIYRMRMFNELLLT
jgi:hypothetical protein